MHLVKAQSLPEGWELALLTLYENGIWIETEYGEDSIDCPVVIFIKEPFLEPRIHLKGIIAGHLKGLLDYVDEILYGTQDYRIGKDWHYTYHERLFNYQGLDQISALIEKLKKAPFTRRAQAITWIPSKDLRADSPPCIQRLWFRVIKNKLVLHVHMRSNDGLKASFMNMYAMTELQKRVANLVGVPVGSYVHIADSFHVYERDLKWFEKFIEQIRSGVSKKFWIKTKEFYRWLNLPLKV